MGDHVFSVAPANQKNSKRWLVNFMWNKKRNVVIQSMQMQRSMNAYIGTAQKTASCIHAA